MNLFLLNLQSNQQIKIDNDTPLIIGRGNVEGCFDKRVSRNHGRITSTVDGKIRLVALHCNPCFFTRNGVPPVMQLKKGEEETLNEGDYLGLLPNAFWFKVTSNKDAEIKNQLKSSSTRTDMIGDEIDQTSVLSESQNASYSQHKEIKVCKQPGSAFNNEPKENSSSVSLTNEASHLVDNCKVFGTPEFEKTRRLPVWMYKIDDPVDSEKSINKHFLNNNNEAKEKRQKILPEIEMKKELKTRSVDETKVEDKVQDLDGPSTSKVENDGEQSNKTFRLEAKESGRKDSHEKIGCESMAESEGNLGSKRPICQYEGNCYRKNPQHKLEFSHPCDSDFAPYEERPLCQYGNACYRRSGKHRTDFRHPPGSFSSLDVVSPSRSPDSKVSSPLPAKRRRKNVKRQNSEYEDDEYDLEDPFINDASSDEFVPSGWESEEEEDDDFDEFRESD